MKAKAFIHFYLAFLVPAALLCLVAEAIWLLHGVPCAVVIVIAVLWSPLALFNAYENYQSGVEINRRATP